MKRSKKNLFLMLALAVFLLVSVAGVGYAYWAGTVKAPTAVIGKLGGNTGDNQLVIGTANDVNTKLVKTTVGGSTNLVPKGRTEVSPEVAGVKAVDFVLFEFDIKWQEDNSLSNKLATGTTGTLNVKAENIKIGSTSYNLVNVKIQVAGTKPENDTFTEAKSGSITIDDTNVVKVYVTVTLTEPDNSTVYTAIVGQDITFDVEFSITDITLPTA